MPEPTPSPTSSFRELTVDDFVKELGSAAPVPGGGSASAVAASLGASLVAMVASLSEGRPKYLAHAALHAYAGETGRRLATRFLDLADEDSVAYAGFGAAMRLPKDTDAEREIRRIALGAAARRASDVPMQTVEACLELVATAETLVGRSNVNASSDLDVAALLGEAAARGAAANVLINLPAVGDEAYAGVATARVMGLLASIGELAAVVHSGVLSRVSRDPLESVQG